MGDRLQPVLMGGPEFPDYQPCSPLKLTEKDIETLKRSYIKASSSSDIGLELVAKLLNDNRTRFRALIEQQTGHLLGSQRFTAKEVEESPKALGVARGVDRFFNQVAVLLNREPNEAVEAVGRLSVRLGSHHFRIRVFFQAENWLCVKNCLLESIIEACNIKTDQSMMSCNPATSSFMTKKEEDLWYIFIQYIIQNMKRGFLAEALHSETTVLAVPASSDDSHSESEHSTM